MYCGNNLKCRIQQGDHNHGHHDTKTLGIEQSRGFRMIKLTAREVVVAGGGGYWRDRNSLQIPKEDCLWKLEQKGELWLMNRGC